MAHLGYLCKVLVARRKLPQESIYADLAALRRFLSGAASSRVGIGIVQAGLCGALLTLG